MGLLSPSLTSQPDVSDQGCAFTRSERTRGVLRWRTPRPKRSPSTAAVAASAGRVTCAMMETVSDGLVEAPEWVGTLRANLEHAGFVVLREQRFDQPFGLYAMLLGRQDMAVQIASDRATGGIMWRIDLMRAEDIGKFPTQYDSPAALRAALEGRPAGARNWDTVETASWVADHLDEIAGALSRSHRRHQWLSSTARSGRRFLHLFRGT